MNTSKLVDKSHICLNSRAACEASFQNHDLALTWLKEVVMQLKTKQCRREFDGAGRSAWNNGGCAFSQRVTQRMGQPASSRSHLASVLAFHTAL